ncbi:MAG: two-component regulator propeller domain-containing protein, partial [Acidobacteriota bacterium]
IGTEGGGLSRWQHASDDFVNYRHDPEDPQSLPSNRIRAIVPNPTGGLWIGTSDSGLALFDPATGTAEHLRHQASDPRSLVSDSIRALRIDRLNNLWVGTMGGLEVYDPGTGGFIHYRHDPANPASLSDDRVLSILEDRDGVLWIGTYSGLNRFVRATTNFTHYRNDPDDSTSLSENRVRTLFEDGQGRLWIGTNGGLNLLQPDTESFARYRHLPSDPTTISGDRVMSIYQDRGGVLWAGTLDTGVNKWNTITWSIPHYKHDPSNPAGLSANMILAFSEGRDGKLWVGTVDHGLDRLDRDSGEFEHFRHDPDEPRSLGGDRVTALLHDRDDVLWVGTATGGLNRFDPARSEFERYQHDRDQPGSLGSNAVMSLFEDSRGVLWVGTYGAGLGQFDRTADTFAHFRNDPADPMSLSHDQVSCLAEDAAGSLWAGTFDGLNRFDPRAGTFLRFESDPARPEGLAHDMVTALHVDPEGVLWIGTHGGGLDRLIDLDQQSGVARFRNYSERDGLPNQVIWGILSESSDALWLATNRGIVRFDPASETFKTYNTSHGVQSDEFNLGAHYRSTGGEMFFGGINGFNAFYPDRIESNSHVPPVVLTSFLKFNQPVALAGPIHQIEEITLGHRDSVFSFEFAALDYTAPEKNRYAYKLDGLTSDWIDLGHLHRASFTNLDPGKYTLQVKGANSDGLWNEEELTLRLTVVPPMWRTSWAYLLYALALTAAGAGYLSATRKKRQRWLALQEAREAAQAAETASRIKGDFLANMSHEIRTPMSGIIGMTELLLLSDLNDKQREQLDTIRVSGDALLEILNDILDFSKIESLKLELESEPFDLRSLIEEALGLVAPNAADKNLALGYWIDPETPETVVGDSVRTRQILMNLLSNGVKFTEAGGIFIHVSAEQTAPDRHEIHFAVEDTGIGMPADRQTSIFQPFSQVDASTTRRYGGTGLGLAICRRLTELMGGCIWVDSKPGVGSTFHFTIAGEAHAQPERSFLYRSDPRLAGRRVLLVAAHPTMQRLLSRQADAWGMLPETVSSATEAINRLQHAPSIDMAIMDRALMQSDEVSWAKGWGRDGRHRDLPLVLLSPLARNGDMPNTQGMGDYPDLSQPVKPMRLFDVLTELAAAVPQKRSAEPITESAPGQTLSRLRVLMAEDNPVNQKVASLMLKNLGYEADVAANGVEVLAALQRQTYDLVLMDVQMPEMDGFETTRRIQRLPKNEQPTIVAMTAHALRGYREKCLDAGMNDYLSKPLKLEPLKTVLERVESEVGSGVADGRSG